MSDKVEIDAAELAELRAKAQAFEDQVAAASVPPDKMTPESPWLAHHTLPWDQAALLFVVVALIAFATIVGVVWLGVNRALQSASPYAVTGQTIVRNACPIPLPSVYLTQCDHLVPGAHIVITPSSGGVTDVTTGADGSFSLFLFEGSYVVRPEPLNGMAPTPASIPLTLSGGEDPVPMTIVYDKGANAPASAEP